MIAPWDVSVRGGVAIYLFLAHFAPVGFDIHPHGSRSSFSVGNLYE